MREEGLDERRADARPRRRSLPEIKKELDEITAEFERLHGKRLLPERRHAARDRRRSA